jgi:hypothetical protein
MTKEELLTEPVMVVFHKTKEGIFNTITNYCYNKISKATGIPEEELKEDTMLSLDLDPKSECLNVKLVPCIRGNVAVSRKARKEIENLFGKTNLKLIKNDK